MGSGEGVAATSGVGIVSAGAEGDVGSPPHPNTNNQAIIKYKYFDTLTVLLIL